VTKLFTVLALLLEDDIGMEDPISKFVPELKDDKWEGVTVGMLAAQMGGAPRDRESPRSIMECESF
jgi:CubicO group peptidase (beta-lactamase class C family)